MKSITCRRKRRLPPRMRIYGALAGFVSGLLGSGGGVIIVFALASLEGVKEEFTMRDRFAMTVACVLPVSVFSVINYAVRPGADFSGAAAYILPGAVGGVLGALVTDKIDTEWLKALFAVITCAAGINMLLR